MSKVKVIEKNEGQKIAWKQNASKLTFGDDELTVNVAKYQKDWSTHLDICGDKDGNLVIGVGEGRYYVAQIDIPAIEYTTPEPVAENAENEEAEAENTSRTAETTPPEPIPLEMADVTLTLWAINGLRD